MATAKDNRSRLSISAQQCSNTTPHTEDPHCEQVIGSSRPPVRSRVHTQQELCELLTKQLNEVLGLLKAGNIKQVLQRQEDINRTKPQQRQPLLPPQPRPTRLPIPQPPPRLSTPPPPPSSPTLSHDTSDQTCDDSRWSIITVSSGYGSLTSTIRSTEGRQSFMYFYDEDNNDDNTDCDLTSGEELDYVTPPTSPR